MSFGSFRERLSGKRGFVRYGIPVAVFLIAGSWLVAYEHYSRLSLLLLLVCAVVIAAWTPTLRERNPKSEPGDSTLPGDADSERRPAGQCEVLLPNEQLASIFRWMPVGIVYYGRGRRVLYCNEAFAKIYGFEKEELIGQVAPLPEARREEWKEIENLLRRGQHFRNVETTRVRKDGTSFRAYISGVPLFGDNRELTGFIGVIVESENLPPSDGIPYEHILSLAESSGDFLLLLDTKLRVVYANPGFVVAAAADEADLHETDVLSYFPSEDRARIERELGEALLPGNNHFVVQARLNLGNDGVTIPVSLEFYPVYGADTHTPSAIACVVHDLQRETELLEQLQQSTTESRTLFEAAPIGIVKVNTKGHLIASNPKFRQMVAYSADELTEMAFASIVHPLDLPGGRALFLELIAGKIEHYQTAKRLVRKDGVVIQTTMTVALVRGATGQPSHTISMIAEVPGGIDLEAEEDPGGKA